MQLSMGRLDVLPCLSATANPATPQIRRHNFLQRMLYLAQLISGACMSLKTTKSPCWMAGVPLVALLTPHRSGQLRKLTQN